MFSFTKKVKNELALKNNLFMNQTTLEMLVSAHRDNSEKKNTFIAII